MIFFIEYAINNKTGNVKDRHKIISIYYDAINPQNYIKNKIQKYLLFYNFI